MPDLSQSLEELENDVWPAAEPGSTYLVRRCTELRHKPLEHFDAEDLRIMLGQRIGVTHLLPIAVDLLERDPLVEGDMYPGDLLQAVLQLDWGRQRVDLRERLASVVSRGVDTSIPEVADAIAGFSGAT